MSAPSPPWRPGEEPWDAPAPTLGDLVQPAVLVDPAMTVGDVQRLFDADPGLRHVVLRGADRPHLVDRLHLDHLRRSAATGPGPAGPGADDVLLGDLTLPGSVVLDVGTPVEQAAATVLGLDATSSIEAVVCTDADGGLHVVSVRRVFESLSRTFAQHSVRDPLTGLPNRLHLMHLLGRRATDTPAALLYVDLDRFKDVNDGHGHAAGDAVLVEFAARMRATCRAEDVVIRLGGDEFAVLVPNDDGDDALHALADRVVAVAEAPFVVPLRDVEGGTATVHVGASVGLARRPGRDRDDALGAMLAQADAAMYLAKDQGRGTVRTYEEAQRVAGLAADDRHNRHTLERRLRQALAGSPTSRLHLVYQPIVALPSGEVVELEALARWDDDHLGPVAPDRFVPVAEAGGLILELGRWAMRTACAQAARWPGEVLAVSVNVSPLQLVDPAFESDVLEALRSAGLPAGRLVLEITEASGVDDLPRTAAVLGRLRERGVQVALDDFGTGRSSLTLLRDLPLDLVKVDRSFVAASSASTTDALVLRQLVDLCHAVGLKVCMEGVEERAQAVRLTGMGADRGQGWWFGRPTADGPDPGPLHALRQPGVRPEPPGPDQPGSEEFDAATRDGVVVYASTTVFDVLGRLPSEVAGRPFDDLVHPSDRAADAGSDPTGAVPGRTVRLTHADGTLRWVLVRSAGAGAGAEAAGGTSLLRCRDVTPVVEAEQRLREAEETFRLVFDAAPSGMALSGLDGVIHRVNDAFATLLGRSPESLVGSTVDDITWPGDRAADAVHLEQHRRGRALDAPVVKRYVGGDGRPVPVHVEVALVHAADGRPARIVAHVRPAPPGPGPTDRWAGPDDATVAR